MSQDITRLLSEFSLLSPVPRPQPPGPANQKKMGGYKIYNSIRRINRQQPHPIPRLSSSSQEFQIPPPQASNPRKNRVGLRSQLKPYLNRVLTTRIFSLSAQEKRTSLKVPAFTLSDHNDQISPYAQSSPRICQTQNGGRLPPLASIAKTLWKSPSESYLARSTCLGSSTCAPGPAQGSPGEMCWQPKVSRQETTECKSTGAQTPSCQWSHLFPSSRSLRSRARFSQLPAWRCSGVLAPGLSVPRTVSWNLSRNAPVHSPSLPSSSLFSAQDSPGSSGLS